MLCARVRAQFWHLNSSKRKLLTAMQARTQGDQPDTSSAIERIPTAQLNWFYGPFQKYVWWVIPLITTQQHSIVAYEWCIQLPTPCISLLLGAGVGAPAGPSLLSQHFILLHLRGEAKGVNHDGGDSCLHLPSSTLSSSPVAALVGIAHAWIWATQMSSMTGQTKSLN